MKARETIIKIGLAIAAVLLIATSAVVASAQGSLPKNAINAKESVVYVFSWIDGTIDLYWEDTGWESIEICFPYTAASGFFADKEGEGYVFTAAHVIEHDEEDVLLAALDALVLSEWWDWGYEQFDYEEFELAYWMVLLEKAENDELELEVDTVDYVYHPMLDEPYPVKKVFYEGDPEGLDVAILKIDVSGAPSTTFSKATEPEEGQAVYTIGYSAEDIGSKFVNALLELADDPRLRPYTFLELIRMAEEKVIESIESEGPSIEAGYVGTPSRDDPSGVWRFHGSVHPGHSGGLVVDKSGNCVGMMIRGSEEDRGYFVPRKYLDQARNQVGFDIAVHRTTWDAIWEQRLHITYAVIAAMVVGAAFWGVERTLRRRRREAIKTEEEEQ